MELEKSLKISERNTVNSLRVFHAEKKKKNTVYRQKIIVTLFLLLFICAGILLTPVFSIKKISVYGNGYVTTDKILEASTAKTDKNIFLFTLKEAEKKIGEISFIDKVTVKRIFPSEVSISVKECVPVAQVMCGQSLYIVIDGNGKILDTAGAREKYGVPVITDMPIDEFEVAKKIVSSNGEDLRKVLTLLKSLSENEVIESVSSVYIKDGSLHAVFNDIVNCNFGQGDNLSYRVKFVKECLQKIPEGQGGEIRFMEDYKAVFTKTDKAE